MFFCCAGTHEQNTYLCVLPTIMIRTTLTPDQQDISVHFHIPASYIGKKVEILLFAQDEPTDDANVGSKSVAGFRGALGMTADQHNEFQEFVAKGREE